MKLKQLSDALLGRPLARAMATESIFFSLERIAVEFDR
jgi:hypothetical protein